MSGRVNEDGCRDCCPSRLVCEGLDVLGAGVCVEAELVVPRSNSPRFRKIASLEGPVLSVTPKEAGNSMDN